MARYQRFAERMTAARAVLHVARQPRTGVWSVMRQLAVWQRARGYRVGFGLLLPKSWPDSYRKQLAALEEDGLEVFVRTSPDLFGTGAYLYHQAHNPIGRWARAFHQNDQQTTVHFHNAWLAGAYLPVGARGVSAVTTFHGVQGERMLRRQPVRRRLHEYWANRLQRYGVGLASVDEQGVETAASLFRLDASAFTVIPNGVSPPSGFVLGGPRLRDPRQPFTVGHVGLIDDGKGWRITGEAAQALHEAGLPVRFLIAGAGPESDSAQAWCAARSDFADFWGYKDSPMRDVFPNLDALSLPSKSEGMPMAVLEAMSLGVVPVVTPVGGLPYVLDRGRSGLLLERSVEAFRNAIGHLIENLDEQRRFHGAAMSRHRDLFSADAMGSAYEALYDQQAAMMLCNQGKASETVS